MFAFKQIKGIGESKEEPCFTSMYTCVIWALAVYARRDEKLSIPSFKLAHLI